MFHFFFLSEPFWPAFPPVALPLPSRCPLPTHAPPHLAPPRRASCRRRASGLVNLNDRADCCQKSGFLPVHAAVANGLRSMYQFLTKDLPKRQLADEYQLTGVGTLAAQLEVHSLTTLQLAAQLGDHNTFKKILRKQCQVQWIWGPVSQVRPTRRPHPRSCRACCSRRTCLSRLAHLSPWCRHRAALAPHHLIISSSHQLCLITSSPHQLCLISCASSSAQFSINLAGVDSAGNGGGDVMELIGKVNARRDTTAMLLDKFMQVAHEYQWQE